MRIWVEVDQAWERGGWERGGQTNSFLYKEVGIPGVGRGWLVWRGEQGGTIVA